MSPLRCSCGRDILHRNRDGCEGCGSVMAVLTGLRQSRAMGPAWPNKRGRAVTPCGPSLGRKRPRRAAKPATTSPASPPYLDVRRTKCKQVFLHCRNSAGHSCKRRPPAPARPLGLHIKKGAAQGDERPKSGRKRPTWATTHRPNRACRRAAYGLVGGAVQLRRSGSVCILTHMLPMCATPCRNAPAVGNPRPARLAAHAILRSAGP